MMEMKLHLCSIYTVIYKTYPNCELCGARREHEVPLCQGLGVSIEKSDALCKANFSSL